MPIELPQPIKKITEESNSFEEVLLLTSKLIPIDGKDIRATRAIDRAYKSPKIFALKDWRTLHEIGLSLWYRQYSNSFNSFLIEDFSKRLQPGYKELINLWLQKNTQLIQVQDAELLRQEILQIWKDFISKLAYIRYLEQQSVKKPRKSKPKADLQFAILSVVTMTIGIGLAIAVSLVGSISVLPKHQKNLTPQPPSLKGKENKERNFTPLPLLPETGSGGKGG